MFKTGIHDMAHAPDFMRRPRDFIALDLYDGYAGIDRDDFQEQAIGRVAVAGGAFKKTHKNRFDEFDDACFSLIRKHISSAAKENISVHDIAISDGRTTLPFFTYLSGMYGDILSFLASDYAAHFRAVYDPQNPARRIILDAQNRMIQMIVPPFVFNVVCAENAFIYPVNFLLRRYFKKTWAKGLREKYIAAPQNFNVREILLLCRECRDLMHDTRFTFDTYDVLSGPRPAHDIIRAMNILNPSYFAPEKMAQVVNNISESLNLGGLLITGSNGAGGSPVNGGAFQKTPDGFKKLAHFGQGSAVESLILKA